MVGEPCRLRAARGSERPAPASASHRVLTHETELIDEEGPLWVTVSKFADEPWRVDFELSSNDMTCHPDRAKQIADTIRDAAARCRDLNA